MLPEIREADGFIVGALVYFGTACCDVMNLLSSAGMHWAGGDQMATL